MSRACVSRTVRLATTRLCREAAALRRTAGARTPVLVRFVLAHRLRRPGHAYLAVYRNKPVQHGRPPRIGRQLGTLVALAVGEEDQPPPQAAQHHEAGRRNAVTAGAGDGHGFRHRLPGRASRVQPRGELTQRVGVQVCDIHPPSLAPPRRSLRGGTYPASIQISHIWVASTIMSARPTSAPNGGSMCGPSRRVATLRDRWRSPAQLAQGCSGAIGAGDGTYGVTRATAEATGKGCRALRDGPGGSAQSGPH